MKRPKIEIESTDMQKNTNKKRQGNGILKLAGSSA